MLAASGVTAEHAEIRGYRTCGPAQHSLLSGSVKIVKPGIRFPGLLIPLLRADGSTWGYQYRPDEPRLRDGKPVKYETPFQQRNGLDVPPGVGPLLADPAIPLWITEGTKKADSGALHGLCIVALTGVWNWMLTNTAGGKMALPEWRDCALNGRRVIMAFDGDVARKPSVQKALHALANYLATKGARIEYLHLPDTDEKTGLDDYLAEHTVEELWRLVQPVQPVPKKPEMPGDTAKPEPPKPKPVSEPIDGAELLDDIERFAGRFLALPSVHHLVVIVLWIAHTWVVSAFYVTPRLVLDSPEPGSGKTRVLEVLALLCPNAKLTISTTTAALYRRIARASIDDPAAAGGGELFNTELLPTILQDEADAVFGRTNNPQAEDLRALYNSGYRRGATVDRCEGDAKKMEVREFPVFAPVAFAGLGGKIPRTILDRSIVLHMRRRAPDEHVDEFRERDARADSYPLWQGLGNWGRNSETLGALRAMRPTMPEGVRDRPAEVWEALLAVADLVGADWPERARAACRYFALDGDPDDLSFGARLLRDIKTVFGDRDRMFSADIIAELTSNPEAEWSDLWGKPLDQRRLAKELKRYGVRPREVRIGDRNAKGYQVDAEDGLAQAWRRYLSSVGMRDKGDKGDIAGQSVADVSRINPERDKRDTSATFETPSEQELFENVADVADVAATDGIASLSFAGNGRPPLCPGCGMFFAAHGHHRDDCTASKPAGAA